MTQQSAGMRKKIILLSMPTVYRIRNEHWLDKRHRIQSGGGWLKNMSGFSMIEIMD